MTIPNSVTSIGWGAFEDCSGLTSVTIPNSVTSIGEDAFSGCSDLTSVEFHCETIGSWFNGLQSIQEVIIGDEVKTIGASAFYGCRGLTSVTIPNSVTSIGRQTFAECSNLTSAIIGSGVTSIGQDAFKNTKLTKTIWLTNTLPSGWEYAKSTVNYKSNGGSSSGWYVYPFLSSYFEADGIVYVPVSPSERTCDAIDNTYDANITNLKIGPTVTYKGIEMTVNNLMPYALSGNTHVKTVELWQDTPLIAEGTFMWCSSIESIIIPKSVAEVQNYAFNGCESLKTVVIEEREELLLLGYGSNKGGYAALFSSCPLETVYIGGNISYNTSSSCGYSPFYRNTTLRSVTITDKETEISENEFYGCTNLKNVKIGNGVIKIGDRAFSGCTSLDYFAFGSSITEIGQEAFSDCVSMTNLISMAKTPPSCGSQALDDINKWNCKLTVPVGYSPEYMKANQWKEFFFIEEGDVSIGIEKVNDDSHSHSGDTKIFDIQGHLRNVMRKGVNIVRMADGTTWKVVVK